MVRIVAAAAAVVMALGLAVAAQAKRPHPKPAPAETSTSTTTSTTVLPTAECPGTAYDLKSQTAMFCRESHPSRAEGPYYLNYVDVVDGRQVFCQTIRTPGPLTTCHPYWPFKNPTVNPHLAPAGAFTGG